MKNSNKSFTSALKGLMLGLTVGTVATMVFSSNSASRKLKKTATNTAENITSMFKMS